MEQQHTLRPSYRDDGKYKRLQVSSLRIPSAMPHEVSLQEAWSLSVPVGKGTYWYLSFQQLPPIRRAGFVTASSDRLKDSVRGC